MKVDLRVVWQASATSKEVRVEDDALHMYDTDKSTNEMAAVHFSRDQMRVLKNLLDMWESAQP